MKSFSTWEWRKQDQIRQYCNVSLIFKGKGNRNSLEFYRRIFRVTVFRNILDRLIYNDEYPKIEEGLTDSNVGARKNRNIRDNIFVLSAVLNSVIRGKEASVDLGIYYAEKCFESVSDIYESGLKND